jgi:hypothetical protein
MEFLEKIFAKYRQEQVIKWFKRICLAEAFHGFSFYRYDLDPC